MTWRDDVTPEDAGSVSITRGDWVDPDRDDRKIPYKLYTPKDSQEKLPLIIWSHGLGGGRDGAGFLSRYIASYGYAVLNIQHAGTDIGLWMGKPGHPWDAIRATKITDEVKFARFHDVHFVLKQLDRLEADIDTTAMGMSGHSMGAMTTQVMAGMKFRDQSFKSEAFKAFIAYSHMPCRDESAQPYADMDQPIFMMTGTEDDSPVDGYDYTARMDVYDQMPESTDKKALILKDGDHMVFAGSRGQLPGYDKIPLHEEIIKLSSLAWWEYSLKGDEQAKQWLDSDFLSDYAAELVDI